MVLERWAPYAMRACRSEAGLTPNIRRYSRLNCDDKVVGYTVLAIAVMHLPLGVLDVIQTFTH